MTPSAPAGLRCKHALALLATLLLGACASQAPRPPPVATLVIPPKLELAPKAAPEPPPDLWQRLRDGFTFADCQRPRVRRWGQHYARHPRAFNMELGKALPRLRYISAIVFEAQLPTEFALLPWVESNFRPIPPHGDRAAGIWQIMPATGRSLGLRIDRHVDQRLDLDASTHAALQLLSRNHARLGDWRLADMAFNAGLYRVRRALASHPQGLADDDLAALKLPRVTLNHVAKVQALACIVRAPGRYGIALPDPASGLVLLRRTLPKGLELAVAARLAGLPEARLQHFNGAIRDPATPATALVLPAAAAHRFGSRYAKLAAYGWQQWRRVRLVEPGSLLSLAGQRPQRAAALALVNQREVDAPLANPSTLWLPLKLAATLPSGMQVADATVPPRHYTVRQGDSLWSIARRFGLEIGEIRTWNHITGSLLQLGQTLILRP